MVRGLDYYMRTTFEIVHGSLGAQNSVLGGGRYDGLAESLGSRVHAPGIGFSIGEDRLVMTVEEENRGRHEAKPDVYIAPMGREAAFHCAHLARELREAGLSVELGLEGKLKRALELANKMAARFALIVGENEIAAVRAMLSSGLPVLPWQFIQAGDRVEIKAGPLAGLRGMAVREKGVDRLVVNVELLQRAVAVEIDRELLLPVRTRRAA